jgi:hypothetical protein
MQTQSGGHNFFKNRLFSVAFQPANFSQSSRCTEENAQLCHISLPPTSPAKLPLFFLLSILLDNLASGLL